MGRKSRDLGVNTVKRQRTGSSKKDTVLRKVLTRHQSAPNEPCSPHKGNPAQQQVFNPRSEAAARQDASQTDSYALPFVLHIFKIVQRAKLDTCQFSPQQLKILPSLPLFTSASVMRDRTPAQTDIWSRPTQQRLFIKPRWKSPPSSISPSHQHRLHVIWRDVRPVHKPKKMMENSQHLQDTMQFSLASHQIQQEVLNEFGSFFVICSSKGD